MSAASISQFDRRLVNQRGKYTTLVLDFSIHPNIWQLWGQISPLARKLQYITHYFVSENHPKNLWVLLYFCLRCLLKSATVTSFSQLHLSRNSGCSRSLDRINLHFLALHTRWLIKKAKKCEKISRSFVGMENFTFREMHAGEKSMGKS